MTWGNRLLDPEQLAAQEAAITAATNPWGARFDLPEDAPAAEAAVEPSMDDGDPTRPTEEQLSVARIEQMLGESPSSWLTLADYELGRSEPRKSALKAILRTAKEEKDTPEDMLVLLEQAIAVLSAPPAA